MEPINLQRKKVAENEERYVWSRYNVLVEPTADHPYLLYNTRSGKLVRSPRSLSELADYYAQPQSLRASDANLLSLGFLVGDYVDELAATRMDLEELKHSRMQHLMILPTEKCNFRCVYCYEEYIKGRMDKRLQEGLIQWVRDHQSAWDVLSLSWFGGEPLLAYEVIKNISTALVELCGQADIKYIASMTTNGYLLSLDRARELLELGVSKYQITLDGPEPQHDHNRHLANGKGTYRKILENLIAIHESDLNVSVTVRVNFDQDNAAYLTDLVDELSQRLENDRRFGFRPFAVGKWGGDHDDELPVLDQEDAVCQMLNSSEYAIKAGFGAPLHEQLKPNHVCYAAMPNSLIIGSDGLVYKCSVAFENPANHVGRLFPDGRIELNRDKVALWVEKDGATDSGCQECRVHPICHGATCPLVRIEANQRPCPPVKRDLEGFVSLMSLEVRQ